MICQVVSRARFAAFSCERSRLHPPSFARPSPALPTCTRARTRSGRTALPRPHSLRSFLVLIKAGSLSSPSWVVNGNGAPGPAGGGEAPETPAVRWGAPRPADPVRAVDARTRPTPTFQRRRGGRGTERRVGEMEAQCAKHGSLHVGGVPMPAPRRSPAGSSPGHRSSGAGSGSAVSLPSAIAPRARLTAGQSSLNAMKPLRSG